MASKFVEQITQAMEKERADLEAHILSENAKGEIKIKEALTQMGITGALITGNKVQIDGMTLRATFLDGQVSGWQVYSECLECFRPCWSIICDRLAEIGQMYHEFIPVYNHRCSATSQTTDEKLIEALRCLIDERMNI